MRLFCSCLVGLLCLSTHSEVRADEPPKFELKDGDRIVLVGDTLIERDQRYGYLETLVVDRNPDKNLVFRNLGWSGDTVGGSLPIGIRPARGRVRAAQAADPGGQADGGRGRLRHGRLVRGRGRAACI